MPTNIEWTHWPDSTGESWNPIRARRKDSGQVGWFCVKASPGCRHCYSERLNRRLGTGLLYNETSLDKIETFLDEQILEKPLHWCKPRTIFVCSMTDLFYQIIPDVWQRRILEIAARTPRHRYLILTKHPFEMSRFFACHTNTRGQLQGWDYDWIPWPLPNVWLGISVENENQAPSRFHWLSKTKSAHRFVSFEPLLEPIGAGAYLQQYRHLIGWVIVGAESGPDRRPFDLAWAKSIYQDCQAAGMPFFGKQASGPRPGKPLLIEGREVKEFPSQDKAEQADGQLYL